jgi:hypothetical protein
MRIPVIATLLLALLQTGLLLSPAPAQAALASLEDADLEEVSGAGIAIALDDFEFAMAPTSYFEQVGSAPAGGGCTGTGSVASNTRCWRRGDLRWYGINISNAGGTNDGFQWNDSTPCSSSSLNCPRGGVIRHFSPFDNPYILRAWSPPGVSATGECVNGATANCAGSVSKTIYEFLAPTSQPNYTFSWWGEMESGSTRNSQTEALSSGTRTGLIKSQNIIRGNAAGSVFRLFNYGSAANPTFAMYYHSYLRGDYRFSVAQAGTGNDTIGQPTVFADTEGMYFRNVDAFIPVGQLYYQALTIKAIGTSGNFELSLTPLPSGATTGDIAVQNKHYGIIPGSFTGAVNTTRTYNENGQGYETARANNSGDLGANWGDYKLTHGYARWGRMDWSGATTGSTTTGRNGADEANDGILFRSCAGCDTFYAYADRPLVIDKRGSNYSKQESQNYQCNTNNGGACTVPGGASGSTNVVYGNVADPTRTYPVTATNAVNLGDSRIEGLMIQTLRIQSCGGVAAC